MNRSLKFIGPLIFSFFMGVFGQQIDLPRVEQMPNQPKPYEMRDWKQVAQDYDSYVFDFSLSGTYLPLIWLKENTVNYPGSSKFWTANGSWHL